MIYERVINSDSVRQGDIFLSVPRVELEPSKLVAIQDGEYSPVSLASIAQSGTVHSLSLPVRFVPAIVVTQDCDASRSSHISLCEIDQFSRVHPPCANTTKPSSWRSVITQHSRANTKWFYLPESGDLGWDQKMAVDFGAVIQVSSDVLRDPCSNRGFRLNDLAAEHFRERLAEYFRRYAYDEWYALNTAELEDYLKRYPDVQKFPWQSNP